MAIKLIDAEALDIDLTDVANSIRAKTGSEEKLSFPYGFINEIDNIESVDSVFEEMENDMTGGYYNYSYYFYTKWHMTKIPYGLIRHTSKGQKFDSMFYRCYGITTIEPLDTSGGVYFADMFNGCENLVTIKGIDISNAETTGGMFASCYSLENITFNGVIKNTGVDLSSSTRLTHDSLMNIINALYDWGNEGDPYFCRLTLGSTNLAKLTDAEKAIVSQKGWLLY